MENEAPSHDAPFYRYRARGDSRLLSALLMAEARSIGMASGSGGPKSGRIFLAVDTPPGRHRANICRLWRSLRERGSSLAVACRRYSTSARRSFGGWILPDRNGHHYVLSPKPVSTLLWAGGRLRCLNDICVDIVDGWLRIVLETGAL